MSALEFIGGLVAKTASRITSRKQPDFTCGDCERWEHCGLTPSEDCIFRLEQLARRDRRGPRRMLAPRLPAGPFY